MKTHLKPTVRVSITLKVPPKLVDKVSTALVKVAAEFEVYEGGKLQQGNVTFYEGSSTPVDKPL